MSFLAVSFESQRSNVTSSCKIFGLFSKEVKVLLVSFGKLTAREKDMKMGDTCFWRIIPKDEDKTEKVVYGQRRKFCGNSRL
jgi:hypothetical protein